MRIQTRGKLTAFSVLVVGLFSGNFATAGVCGAPLKEVIYSASFYTQTKARVTLNIDQDGKALFRSQGSRGPRSQCLAVCRINAEKPVSVAGESALLSMNCKSPVLGMLESEALIVSRSGGQRPVLRFGSWLRGYEESVLRVHYDGTLKKRPKHFAPTLAVAK